MSLEDRLYGLLGFFDTLPSPVRSGLGQAYRHLPERARFGPRFKEFRALAEEVESWSPARISEYQTSELRRVLTHAAAHSPFYSARFAEAGFRPERLSDPSELRDCPVTTKADLAAHLHDMDCSGPKTSKRLHMTTGGSTGTPVAFYLERGVSRPKEFAFLNAQWRRGGYFDGARTAVIRGHVVSDRSKGRIASYDPTRNWLMLSSYHLTEERIPEYLEAIARFQPEILHAYPSSALLLADYLTRTGAEWPAQLRGVLAGSERLTAPQRRILEEAFGCRVYHWYGHAERAVLAGEGRRPGPLYFWPTYGYVEFGSPDANGLQEVIGTSFHNLVMPLIRYRTGDYVKVFRPGKDEKSEYSWPAARSVEGREQEFLVTATGRRISLTSMNMHDHSFDGVCALQFFQREQGLAELRYVPAPNFDKSRLLRMERAIRHKTGDDLVLVLREVDRVERTAIGKARWLVSELAERSLADTYPTGRD